MKKHIDAGVLRHMIEVEQVSLKLAADRFGCAPDTIRARIVEYHINCPSAPSLPVPVEHIRPIRGVSDSAGCGDINA